jgi:hypothetical protein
MRRNEITSAVQRYFHFQKKKMDQYVHERKATSYKYPISKLLIFISTSDEPRQEILEQDRVRCAKSELRRPLP